MKRIEGISVSSCVLGAEEQRLVAGCITDNWITIGEQVRKFEAAFALYCRCRHAVASNNGTTALHLALTAVGVQGGDEVIVPDLTYVASANAVSYCGAKPVFCDVLPDTWCMDPTDAERKINEKTKAIMAVHLYGHPCDMRALRVIARRHGIALVEDAAEAHGAEVHGERVGNLSDVASFSFYANKLITTGEGGMCTTNSREIAETIRLYRGQGVDPDKRYWHKVIGYNYRMMDLQGAIGCAQMRRLDANIEHHRMLARVYERKLKNSGLILPVEKEWAKNVYWLYSIVIPKCSYRKRDQIIKRMEERGVETRPFFYPLHQLPPYRSMGRDENFPVASFLARGGISLPTHSLMTRKDAAYVADSLLAVL